VSLLPYDALKDKGITLSKCQLWRLEREGKFPARVHVSARSIAWPTTEIDAYIAERTAAREKEFAERATVREKKAAARERNAA
jgi:prophage regulatory protein